jgi:hypothetical protein
VGKEDNSQDDAHDEKGLGGEGAEQHVHDPLLLTRMGGSANPRKESPAYQELDDAPRGPMWRI